MALYDTIVIPLSHREETFSGCMQTLASNLDKARLVRSLSVAFQTELSCREARERQSGAYIKELCRALRKTRSLKHLSFFSVSHWTKAHVALIEGELQ
jgi:hypothetical protein